MPASSSRSIIRYLEEVTPGTIVTGTGPQTYRVTGGALNQSIESVQSAELRTDRGQADSTLVSGSVGGPLNVEFSHKTHDDFLEALLASTYTEVGTDGVAAVADAVFVLASNTLTSATTAFPAMEAGQWFQISGANNTLNDGIYKCSSSIAPTTGLITLDTNVKSVGANDATDNSVNLSSSRLKQSNDDARTFTLERELDDVEKFFTWPGAHVSSLSLSYDNGAKVTGVFNFMAEALEIQAAATAFDTSPIVATTTPSFNLVTNSAVLLDGSDMGESCVMSATVDINANLRERRCLTSGLAASSIGEDQFTITVSTQIYFGSDESAALYQKKLTDSAITFTICVTDADGDAMAITMPRGKITEASIDGGGLNSDIVVSMNFSCATDTTTGTMIIIDRLGSVA